MTWEIDYDPTTWLEVPDVADDAADEWVERATEAVAKDFANNHDLDAGYREVLRYQLEILTGVARRKGAAGWQTLAHLPGPDWYPFPVFLAFLEPEEDSADYLLELAGARGGPAVQPPTVEHVVTDDLGEGIRVTRYDQPDGAALTESICYAWRARDTDVVLLAQSDDLARLGQMHDDLTALTAAIHPASGAESADDD